MNEKFVKVEVFIDTTNPDQLLILSNLLHTVGGTEVKAPEEEEPKPANTRTRKPKPAEDPKPAAEEAKPAAEAPAPAEEAKPTDAGSKTYTIEEVREKLKEKVNDHREAIKAKLTELGAPNVSSLDPAKYAEFMNFLNGCE